MCACASKAQSKQSGPEPGPLKSGSCGVSLPARDTGTGSIPDRAPAFHAPQSPDNRATPRHHQAPYLRWTFARSTASCLSLAAIYF